MKKLPNITPLPNFDEEIKTKPDFHSVVSISFGELLEEGIIRWNEEPNKEHSEYPRKITWNWKKYVYLPYIIEKDGAGKVVKETPDYNKQQEIYDRLCEKIELRFFARDISNPIGYSIWNWKRDFIRTLGEIMPKYNKLYAIIDDIDILQTKNKYGKRRDISSSFPQTLLNNHSDYASSGKDKEYEEIENGDILQKIKEANLDYNDIDVMILNDLEKCFSPLLAVNINSI